MIDEQIASLKAKIKSIENKFRILNTIVILVLICLYILCIIKFSEWFVLMNCFLILVISGLLAVFACSIGQIVQRATGIKPKRFLINLHIANLFMSVLLMASIAVTQIIQMRDDGHEEELTCPEQLEMKKFEWAQNLISILYICFDNYVNFFLLYLLVKFSKPTSINGSITQPDEVPSVIFAHDMKLAVDHC